MTAEIKQVPIDDGLMGQRIAVAGMAAQSARVAVVSRRAESVQSDLGAVENGSWRRQKDLFAAVLSVRAACS